MQVRAPSRLSRSKPRWCSAQLSDLEALAAEIVKLREADDANQAARLQKLAQLSSSGAVATQIQEQQRQLRVLLEVAAWLGFVR